MKYCVIREMKKKTMKLLSIALRCRRYKKYPALKCQCTVSRFCSFSSDFCLKASIFSLFLEFDYYLMQLIKFIIVVYVSNTIMRNIAFQNDFIQSMTARRKYKLWSMIKHISLKFL